MCGYGWGNGWHSSWGWGRRRDECADGAAGRGRGGGDHLRRALPVGQREPSPSSGAGPEGMRAEDRLADRFARGEIDGDEFRQRMALLREHR